MNDTTDPRGASAAANERVTRLFAAQQAAFDQPPYPSAGGRRGHLKALKRQVRRYQDVLAEAMSRDFATPVRQHRAAPVAEDVPRDCRPEARRQGAALTPVNGTSSASSPRLGGDANALKTQARRRQSR